MIVLKHKINDFLNKHKKRQHIKHLYAQKTISN